MPRTHSDLRTYVRKCVHACTYACMVFFRVNVHACTQIFAWQVKKFDGEVIDMRNDMQSSLFAA